LLAQQAQLEQLEHKEQLVQDYKAQLVYKEQLGLQEHKV
jgi:hypothetical protein